MHASKRATIVDRDKGNRQTSSLHCNNACFCCTTAQHAAVLSGFEVMRWAVGQTDERAKPRYCKLVGACEGVLHVITHHHNLCLCYTDLHIQLLGTVCQCYDECL